MKKLTTIVATLAICFGITVNTFAQSSAPLYLNVTIDDSVSATAGIQSDDPDKTDNTPVPYQNGTNSVTAVFNDYGHFVFNSGANRKVNFIYSIPLDATNSVLETDSQYGVKARTAPINSTNYVHLQNMDVGTSQCLGLGWELTTGDVTGSKREIGYHYFRGVLTNTAYVTVTRLDLITWTMEPLNRARCGGNDDVTYDNAARVRDVKTAKGKTTDYQYGRYYMPFKLTLTKQ